jgi:MFS family permease
MLSIEPKLQKIVPLIIQV